MSAGGASHHNGAQPPYVVWDTNGVLPPSNAVEEGMFTPDVSGTMGDMSTGADN